MSRLGSHQTAVRLLRTLLAAALVAFLAVVGLYLFGRQGRPSLLPVAATESSEDDDFKVRSEGFEFALTRGDQVVFEIRGREQRSDRAGKVHLEEVRISMRRDDGEYRVESDRALYDQEQQNARLEGDVVIRGGELTILSDQVDLEAGGQRIVAREGVRLRTEGGLEGRADSLRADLNEEVVTLLGNVVVHSDADASVPFRLETRELFIREKGPSAHARGGLVIESRGNRLRAQRLNLFLDPETREVTLLRVLWEVEGEISASAEGPPFAVEATALSLVFDPEAAELQRLEIRGLVRRPARLTQSRADGEVLEMILTHLTGHFERGRLTRADLSGPLEIVERRGSGATREERRARAERGEARFEGEAARLAGLTLIDAVSFTDGELRAVGERAYVDMVKDSLEVLGEPAHVVHVQGELDAPRVVFRSEDGLLHATGGVVAELRGAGDGLGSVLPGGGDGDRPIRVESAEAFWQAEPETVFFRGSVRAWQGDNTLFAEQLRAEPAKGWMAAGGGVRSIWRPAADAAATPPAPSEPMEGEEPEPLTGPLEITADEMLYEDAPERLVYTGSVHAEQGWMSMRCQRLSVLLEKPGRARELQCEDEVRIVDARNERVLEGDRALYQPGASLVEVFGDPLTVVGADGSRVEGAKRFTYDLESGNLRLTAKASGVGDA